MIHLEFELPKGAPGLLNSYYKGRIETSIIEWMESNGIKDYDIRMYYSNLALTLSKEQHYTLFLLSWNEPNLPVPKLVHTW